MTAPSDDLNDLQSDIGNLHHLLSVLYAQTTEQQFVHADGSRNTQADELSALAMIARDLAERMNEAADACLSKVLAESRAIKTGA
ncbi:hypothetical protein [Mesorhizobium sp. M0220]|uniref:hypothetical protein n=1 Tax=Mesorhizobium sp. M0220 TaxID=2956920 RepID=UPI003339D6CF